MTKERQLTFVGVNRPRLRQLADLKNVVKERFKKSDLPIFPLKDFVQFEGYHTVQAWAQERWGPIAGASLSIFYIQAWAFVNFLNEYKDGKYREAFTRFLNDMLNHPKEASGYTFEKFKKQFALTNDAKWKALQEEFEPYYKQLQKMDLDKVGPLPPGRDDWPGYVAPDSLDENPAAAAKEDEAGMKEESGGK
jgi:hypothetical protein